MGRSVGAKTMKTEKLNGHRFRCYDNGGATADRFTVVYLDIPEGRATFGGRGMSADPFHPQGVGMWCECLPGRHLGKRIAFSALPEPCQRLIRADFGVRAELAKIHGPLEPPSGRRLTDAEVADAVLLLGKLGKLEAEEKP